MAPVLRSQGLILSKVYVKAEIIFSNTQIIHPVAG